MNQKNMPMNQETDINFAPSHQPVSRRYKLIACEIIYREICSLIADCENIIDVEFLRKGLHDAGSETMVKTIQEMVNQTDKKNYDAILLGYGRCNNGTVGLKSQEIPLVIPRAHDCITFFFGSQQAYDEYFAQNPGTFYRTTGWIERDIYDKDSVMHQMGLDRTFDQYVAQYGIENAEYIMQSLGTWQQHYNRFVYIDMGLPLDDNYAQQTQQEARDNNMEFQRLQGNSRLLRSLLSGQWSEDEFLIVPPGNEVAAEDNGKVIVSVKC